MDQRSQGMTGDGGRGTACVRRSVGASERRSCFRLFSPFHRFTVSPTLKWSPVFPRAGVWVLRLAVVVTPLILIPGIYQSAPLPKLLILQITALLLALCGLFARRFYLPRHSPFVLPLLLYLLITAVQTLRSANPSAGLLMLATQVSCGMVCLGAAGLVAPMEVRSIIRFSAAAGLVASVVGILEYLGVAQAMLPSAGRPSATFGFRNIAGMYLAVNLPLAAGLVFSRERRDWMLGVVAAGSMAAFLIFTRTRGAWLGLAVAGAVGVSVSLWVRSQAGVSLTGLLWGRLTRLRRVAVSGAIIVAAALVWLPPGFQDQSLHRLDEKKTDVRTTVASMVHPGGDRGRLRVWKHTLQMILAYPVAGVGLENWSVLFPRYDKGDVLNMGVAPKRPHNDFLWIWSELGTAGLAVYLWLLWAVGKQIVRKLRSDETEAQTLALFLGMGMLAMLVHAFFSFPREQAAPSLLFWMALGLVGRAEPADGDRLPAGRGVRVGAGMGAAVALAGLWLCASAMGFDRHFARALDAQNAGAAEAQLAEARRALDKGTFDHRAFLLMGDAMTRLGDLDGAAETYRDYLTYQPSLPAVHNNLGRVYDAAGAFDRAENAYLQGLEIFSGEPMLMNNLAVACKKQGKVAQALEVYDQLGAKDAKAHHNLGLIYAEQGAYEKALAAYQAALRQDAEMVEVLYSLGGLYMLMGDYPASAEAFDAFLKRWTGNSAYIRRAEHRLTQIYPALGKAYIVQGDLERAEMAYERLVALDAATAEVYNNLSVIYRRKGDRPAARAACQKALAADPEFAHAYFTLGELLLEAGEQEGALKAYEAFLSRWSKEDRFAQQARRRVNELESREIKAVESRESRDKSSRESRVQSRGQRRQP